MEWIPSFLPPTSSSSSSSSSTSIFGGYKLPRNQLLVAALCNFFTQIRKFSAVKYNLSSSLPELLNKPPLISSKFYLYLYIIIIIYYYFILKKTFGSRGVSFNLHALEEFEWKLENCRFAYYCCNSNNFCSSNFLLIVISEWLIKLIVGGPIFFLLWWAFFIGPSPKLKIKINHTLDSCNLLVWASLFLAGYM